eukprot:TRINITY_DN7457_c0_g1_i1.p1 TRINITY_DN7457_c0_g1~~TRINITY_DN7457_c0_g1_i1.p1  ORF type:complete len:188 (+),score=52.33 TRINITY_DN7457_c0_g1_i1:68-631(+)
MSMQMALVASVAALLAHGAWAKNDCGPCKNTVECADNQYCQFCLKIDPLTGFGRCGQNCGGICHADSDCALDDPTKIGDCPYCYNGVCSHTNPQNTCLSGCVSDRDCDPAPVNATTDCKQCVLNKENKGQCGAGCGRRCGSDSQCIAPSCPVCGEPIPDVCGPGKTSDVLGGLLKVVKKGDHDGEEY